MVNADSRPRAPQLELRLLLPADSESVMAFSRKQLETEVHDNMEREMQSWNARWRGEALQHYLALGWSFGCFGSEPTQATQLKGYVLAQPLLFFRGLTQTLWVEYLTFDNAEPEVGHALLDCVHRWARDKHLQCVLAEAEGEGAIAPIARAFNRARVFNSSWVEIK